MAEKKAPLAGSKRIMTKLYPKLFDQKEATQMYTYLKDTVLWGEGVKSKVHGHTRLAASYGFDTDEKVTQMLLTAFSKVKLPENIVHLGMYLNYQRNGNEFTPSHRHQGQIQVVICLGPAKRVFVVGKTKYTVGNGDVIVFGGSNHELLKDSNIKEGRISIASFSKIIDPEVFKTLTADLVNQSISD